MKRRLAVGFGRVSVLLMGVASAPVARAAPPPSLRVGGEPAGCPTPGQVVTVLKRLLRSTQVTAEPGRVGPEDAAIFDQGSQFRVTVAGQERSFDDAPRECSERAQHAAVFVALILDPPMIAEPPAEPMTPAPAPPTPAAAEQPHPTPAGRARPMQWDLALGGVFLVAPSTPDRRTAFASGAAAWVRGNRGFHLGFGVGLLHGALQFDDAAADAWWFPIDVAVGFTANSSAWELGAEIGPNASVLSIVGKNLPQAERQVRLEVGLRTSGWARFWFSKKFALFLSADGVFRPMPYALLIDPQGEVGQTPAVWLGASAGLAALLE